MNSLIQGVDSVPLNLMTQKRIAATAGAVLLTQANKRRLEQLLSALSPESSPESAISLLRKKLDRATVVGAGIPRNYVTMGSTVSIIDAKTSEKLKFSLVYPDRVNFALGRVSVFSPLGATILGHRVGDEPDWGEDDEIGRFVIAKVDFQPEAMRRRLRRDNRFDS